MLQHRPTIKPIAIVGGAGGFFHKGHHHFIDKSLVAGVEGDKVRLSANADVAVTLEVEK